MAPPDRDRIQLPDRWPVVHLGVQQGGLRSAAIHLRRELQRCDTKRGK